MQNFSETFLTSVDGVIAVPTANRSEAFIDAEDIAAVAARTLASPDAHAGAAYALTGPKAITVSQAAAVIADVTGSRWDDLPALPPPANLCPMRGPARTTRTTSAGQG